MREILFRGKRTDNGEWIVGSLCTTIPSDEDFYTISYFDFEGYYVEKKVIPETVGQYTGLTDKNGKQIFEGDIIRKTNKGRHSEIFTANIHTDFRVKEEVYYGPFEHLTESCEYEIIGNIHDNPELLKGGDK